MNNDITDLGCFVAIIIIAVSIWWWYFGGGKEEQQALQNKCDGELSCLGVRFCEQNVCIHKDGTITVIN